MSLYHREGAGRKPYPAISMLKAQLLKHLWRVPSDRRLALLLKRDRKPLGLAGSDVRLLVTACSLSLDIV